MLEHSRVEYIIEAEAPDAQEDLWKRLRESLLEALYKKRERKPRGRPKKGFGSSFFGGKTEAAIAVAQAYKDLSRPGHPAQHSAVARRLKISITTLWRIRNALDTL
jgi:hypothetical protein